MSRPRQPEAERAHSGETTVALAHCAGHLPCGLKIVALEVYIECDQGGTRADDHAARPLVEADGAEVRRELARVDAPLQLDGAASPEEGGPAARREVGVEEDRQRKLLPHPSGKLEGRGARPLGVGLTDRHDGNDVGGADAGMRALVASQVDPVAGTGDSGEQRGDEFLPAPDQRVHGSVVILVAVDVEHTRVRRERVTDCVDRRAVAPLGEVRHRLEGKHGQSLRSTPVTARKASYRSLASLHRDLSRCRACAEAGHPLESLPVRVPGTHQRAYLLGQAPGVVEGEQRLPWRGRAGRTLRRWLELEEDEFYAAFYCASVTRCYPGRAPSGRGDRTPTPREQDLCSFWRDWELELLRPRLIVTVGGLALRRLLGQPSLTPCVGERYELDGASVVPLPHPSGASGWLNDPANRERLARAARLVTTELARLR